MYISVKLNLNNTDDTTWQLSGREVCRKDDQTLLVLLTCRESWRGLRRCLFAPSVLSLSIPSLILLCCSSSLLSLSLRLCARAVNGQKELTAAETEPPGLPLRDLDPRCTVEQQDRYGDRETNWWRGRKHIYWSKEKNFSEALCWMK